MALNLLFTKWLNAELIRDLEKVVDRIPKDLKTWEKEIKRLKYRKDRKNKKLVIGYFRLANYYLGKMMAYIYVLEKLGDSAFVRKWEKKFKVKYITKDDRGGIVISGKW